MSCLSFRLKITVCMIWLLAVVFGIGSGLMISLSFRRTLDQELLNTRSVFCMTTEALRLIHETAEPDHLDGITETLSTLRRQNVLSSVRLTVDGVSVFEEGAVADRMLSLASDLTHYHAATFQEPDGAHYLQIGGMMTVGRETLALDIACEISSVYEMRTQQLALCRRLFFAMVGVGTLAAWGLAWLLTRPLAALSRASRELARGHLDFRARVRSQDEVGALAADFNHMAEKLDSSMAELQQSVERQERFMGSFAHELKTPMTSIIGYADLLRTQALTPDEQMEAANYIFTESKRLETLSLKLLELLVAKSGGLTFSAVEPAQLIESLIAPLRPVYAAQGIQLVGHGAPGWCMLEPDLVRSLLLNLIDNARKALEAGGVIRVTGEMTDSGCVLRIADNGRGMPAESLSHLTEAFYRVDKSRSRAQGGSGLGLALCAEIVRQHGGTLSFESHPGAGTCVTATLNGGIV